MSSLIKSENDYDVASFIGHTLLAAAKSFESRMNRQNTTPKFQQKGPSFGQPNDNSFGFKSSNFQRFQTPQPSYSFECNASPQRPQKRGHDQTLFTRRDESGFPVAQRARTSFQNWHQN